MKYSEPLRAQLLVVFVFLGVGFLLGVWYLICSFLRKLAYEKRSVTFLSDILFFFGAFAVCFASFLSYTNGLWRLPALLSAVGGFCLFRLSFGFYLAKAADRLASLVRHCFAAVFVPIQKRSDSLHSFLQEIRRKTAVRLRQTNCKNCVKSGVSKARDKLSRKKKK